MGVDPKISKRDPFSTLADSLLYIIVSFLPFKEAVRTSILSKQWRYIWRSTANIELDESFFVNHEESAEIREERRRDFLEFAKEWIRSYQEPTVKNFAFSCSKPGKFLTVVQEFIKFALKRNTKGLALDFSDPEWKENDTPSGALNLPLEFYKHVSLESLKLVACNLDVSAFNFRNIKDLSLGWIELNESSMKTLLNNCPLLESLCLKNCWNMFQLIITDTINPRLKRFVLEKCIFFGGPNWVYIDGPSLRFFKYSGLVGYFKMENQRCIEEAELDFGSEPEFDMLGDLLCELLEQLFSAKVLTVDSVFLQVVPCGTEPLRTSNPLNTKHLILKTSIHNNELLGIKFLLESCPFLETLTIDLGPSRIFPDYVPPFQFTPAYCWTRDLVLHKCLIRSMKVIEVKGFKGTMNELLFLKYLLVLGLLLEQLNIYLSNDVDEDGNNIETYRKRAMERVLPSIISSKKLQINFMN
ncbi:hypothetical protein SLE2022_395990 [Rubroshorea leprosula]